MGTKIPEETLRWFGGDELRARVFYEKYALRDENGVQIEKTPPEMWRRVAKEIASVEEDEKKREFYSSLFYEILSDFKFIPGGRIMFGAGNKRRATLLNCYYIPIKEDSIEGIFDCAKEMARTYSFGGGVGIDITILRPKGSPVNNSAIFSTGAVSFMDLFSKVTGTIGQCLAKGTRVLTESGIKNIEDIKVGERVWTDIGWQRVSYVFQPRRVKLFKVRTKYGFEIIASDDHKFLDENFKLKPLKKFKEGDKVIMIRGEGFSSKYQTLKKVGYKCSEYNNSNGLKEIHQPEHIDEEFAWWLGYLFGDGEIYKMEKSVEFSISVFKEHPEIKDRIVNFTTKLFGIEPKVIEREGENRFIIRFNSKYLFEFLKENKILKESSYTAYIPEIIFGSPSSVLSAFLAGLFDSDGYVGVSKLSANTKADERESLVEAGEEERNEKFRIRKGYVFSTVSEKLAKDVQIALLSLGIVSKIKIERREKKGWKGLYQISITGSSSCSAFLNTVGKYSLKIKRYGNIIPKRDNILTPYDTERIKIKQYHSFLGSGKQLLSLSAFGKAMELGLLLQDGGFEKLNVLFIDRIEKIEFLRDDIAYDIEVENAHMFFANGFYVSNSGRRGALMITIEDRHPDIFDFIDVKDDPLRLNVRFANISVKVSDELMRKVKENGIFTLWFESEKVKRIEMRIRARDLWARICNRAWSSAEPGVIFWDTAKRFSPTEYDEKMSIKGCNPCSEQMLEDYGCCNLGNINLMKFVKNVFGKKPDVEKFWEIVEKKGIEKAMEYAESKGWAYPDLLGLQKVVRVGMRFLDDVLDYSAPRHPLPQQKEASLYTRRTGLGATGLADMLCEMRIKYDTDEAVYMMDKLFEFIKNTAYDESVEIAKEKGSFPAFRKEKHVDMEFVKGISEEIREKIWNFGIRNACLLTIPPVGSGAILGGTTGGIEPIFALSYIRRSESLSQGTFKVYHWLVALYLAEYGGKGEEDLPDFFITAHQIDPKMRVRIQGVIQKHIDSSISSTVNLPKNTTPEEIGKIYELAWEYGCKGITVYREGSREGVLITEEEYKSKSEDFGVVFENCPECGSSLKSSNSHLVCRTCGIMI